LAEILKTQTLCVLGMHRSGTSCLTGTLEEAGVFLGEISRKNPHNLKGNHENSKIMALHEDVLQTNGGSWDSPPDTIIWSEKHKITRDEIIGEYENALCWGFKDPRTLFMLEGWIEAIPELTMVGIFRHPILVAQSLQARDGFSIEQGIDLWVQYNEKLLTYYDRYQFPILSFDTDEQVFRNTLSNLLRQLDLPTSPEQFTFFDPILSSTKVQDLDGSLLKHVSQLYEHLNRVGI